MMTQKTRNLQVKKGLPSPGAHEKSASLVEIPESLHFKLYSPSYTAVGMEPKILNDQGLCPNEPFEKRLGPVMTIENIDFHSDDHLESQPAVCVHVVWTNIFHHINGYLCCSPPRAYVFICGDTCESKVFIETQFLSDSCARVFLWK